MKVIDLINLLSSSKVDPNAELSTINFFSEDKENDKVLTTAWSKMIPTFDKLVQQENNKKQLAKHPGWHSVHEKLPRYNQDVIVHLTNDTKCVTHRTTNDYSKDSNDFLHQTFAVDVDYWIDFPKF